MDIIISPNILTHYFANKLNPKKSEIDKSIDELIDNPINRIALCKLLTDEVGSKIDNGNLKEYYKNYIAQIINGRCITPIVEQTTEASEIFKKIHLGYEQMSENSKHDFCLAFRKTGDQKANDGDCILEEYKKPNSHWLGYNLAAHCPRATTVRYFDFNDDSEINSLMNFYISKCNSNSAICIFDRNLNLDHSLFSCFCNTHNVHYYTEDKYKLANDENIKELRAKIKRIKMFVAKKKVIHERRILIGNLIIEFDDDFWDISVDKNTWKIDVTYCPTTANMLKMKVSEFKKWN